MKSNLLKASLSLLLVLSACAMPNGTNGNNSNYATKTSFPPVTSTEKLNGDSKIVQANNKFGTKMFNELLKTDSDKNIFISPSSVLFSLAMAHNGAKGTTKDEMAKALELSSMSSEEINKGANALIRTLVNVDSSVKLDIANSLWARKGVSFSNDFKSTNEEYFKATTNTLDFNSADASKTINEWVSNATQGKISKIVDDKISPDTLLFLINAIYFKGDWANKFDKSLTKEQDFNLTDGSTKKVQMMSLYKKLAYFSGENFQALSLPYGNENVSMYVFLPNNKLEDFNKNLTEENLSSWFGRFSKKDGNVKLPKFKLEYEKSLNDSLKALGMSQTFNETADFSGMFNDATKAMISNVKHKTYIDVNEEGTEAAAVTSSEVVATSAPLVEEPFDLTFDKPFFYLIRDNSSGTILFMGEVVNP